MHNELPVAEPAMTNPIFIVEDDEQVRSGLVYALESAGYHPQAFEAAEPFLLALGSSLTGGCIITDYRLPGMDGLALLDVLVRRQSPLHIVVMTAYAEVHHAVHAMRHGAFDFVEKPFEPGELVQVVERAMAIRPPRHVLYAQAAEAARKLATLKPREREVFDRLAEGQAGKDVAASLGLSPRTVEIYRANALQRLGLHTIPDMVRFALLAQLAGPGGVSPATASRPSDRT